ncbi:uncharacterized protein LOC141618250 [Silene latifolia]|uniref:uncharacterized protein LOC141618250 n=1 Tax=Silene latifolia TaxID=37657 RepID=UPI003D76C19F
MRTSDGTADPQNHVAYYKQIILAASIPRELRQVCMCKGFGTTLTGPALHWYINLRNGSIKSFADLINSFNHQFSSSRELEKRSSDLYRIKQKPDETIRAFLTRFNKEKVLIPRCDVGTTVEALRQGLPLDIDFYDELTMKPCQTLEDVQAKALGYIRLEEDKSFKAETTNSVSGYERLIKRLDNMGDIVKWPKKTDNLNSRKDTTRWCEFHMDIGHTTNEFLDVHRQVGYLLKKGYLKDLMPSKNRILVDGGRSVNLIMLDVLKAMTTNEDQINKDLPTYIEGVSSYERFGVLDCLSSYNAILGRPWIHNVTAIPSTYHQCVKIPTE